MAMTKKEVEEYAKANPLSPALNGKFQLKNALAGVYTLGGKKYDLRVITLDQAEELMKAGFPFLETVSAGNKPPKND